MYTNHLLTNARPRRSEHLTVLYGLEITLFILLCCSNESRTLSALAWPVDVWADIAARPDLAPKLANLLLHLLHLRISAIFSRWRQNPDSAKLSFLCGCVPANDASVRNKGRSFARMASSSRWSSYTVLGITTGKVPGVQMKHESIYFPDSPQTGILAWAALYTTVWVCVS